MGYGDDILAVGQAIKLGYKDGGVEIGRNRKRLHHSPMFRGLGWVNSTTGRHFLKDYIGRRGYVDYAKSNSARIALLDDYRAHPGELALGPSGGAGAVVIHTDVKRSFSGENRMWPASYWEELVRELDCEVLQVDPPGTPLVPGTVRKVEEDPRRALAWLQGAALLVTTEGLFHHAAAALGVPTIVLWGGRTNPRILGYESHRNLTALEEWCGSRVPCDHCKMAMAAITPDRVMAEAVEVLG